MKKYAFVAALVAATCWSIASKPMESVDRYNVVLVHGAADRWQGLDCENADTSYSAAYGYKEDVVLDSSTCVQNEKDTTKLSCSISYSLPSRIGGITRPDGEEGSSATGMVKVLAPLLRDTILESPLSVYLQRPFTHPAGSPADNAHEIGDRRGIYC